MGYIFFTMSTQDPSRDTSQNSPYSFPQDNLPGTDRNISVSSQENRHGAKSFLRAFFQSIRHPERMPSGINDWSYRYKANDPLPVVLIHGTWLNSYNTWSMMAPQLAEAGYKVYAFNYGRDTSSLSGRPRCVYGARGLLDSRDEVAEFITKVMESTGAPQVDLIGHSQGVAQARMYLSDRGGADSSDPSLSKVRTLIGIGGSNHGTKFCNIVPLAHFAENKLRLPVNAFVRRLLGQAAIDQMINSDAMAHVNRDGDTCAGVKYVMIATRFDEIVTPWRTQFLTAKPGHSVENIELQVGAIRDFSDHLSILYSPYVLDLVKSKLGFTVPTPSEPYGTVLPTLGELKLRRRSRNYRSSSFKQDSK